VVTGWWFEAGAGLAEEPVDLCGRVLDAAERAADGAGELG
jgi:hypothetical protein